MTFQHYPRYRNSGVAWFGELPAHWELAALKRGYEVCLGKMLQLEPTGPDDTLLPYVRAANVRWAGIDTEDIRQMWFTPRERAALELRAGDLLVSEGGDVGRACVWAGEIAECGLQNSVNRVRARLGNSTKFLYYWMVAIKEKGYVEVLCNKSTIAHFTAEKVASVPVPYPPPDEQERIASYLDRATSKLDALIAEQQRLIELLKEKRQTVISRVVTKGLNPDALMRPSGVEWLGDVPAEWIVSHLGQVCESLSYGFTNPMPTTDEGPYLLTANDIGYGAVDYDGARRTSPEAYRTALTPKSRPSRDDILLTKDGTLGRVAVHDGREACINQSVASLRVKKEVLSPHFVARLLLASIYQDRMIFEAGGTTIKHIYISRLAKMPIAFPSLPEQHDLLAFLQGEVGKLDALILEAERANSLLQERRTALISAVVTGKIDVRGLVDAEAIAA